MKMLDIIPEHETWNVIDSSKLTTYMSCPRKFFYRYILGWEREIPNHHLAFGTCWHLAVEHLLRNDYSKEAVEEASFLFFHKYQEMLGGLYDEKELAPKDMENALLSLKNYAVTFMTDIKKYEVLHTEIAGLVLISPVATMHFKLDALLRDKQRGKVLFLDHKTSQRKYSNWGDHWLISTQMMLYLHALYCLYPREEVGEAKVRCSFFYKKSMTEFEEKGILKTPAQMTAWLARVNSWYSQLRIDHAILEEDDDTENNVMLSFPQNDTQCFSYGRECDYFNFCEHWNNPLQRIEEVPFGFQQRFWDPRKNETIRERVEIIGGDK